MPTATAERRKRTRTPVKPIPVQVASAQWGGLSVPATIADIHEEGCGLRLSRELAVGLPLMISGDLLRRGETVAVRGRVVWSQMGANREWRAGIQFSEKLPDAKEADDVDADAEDLYELLQVSPNADADTIHRVYRFMAQRFHPDNRDTGDASQFRKIHEAYHTLSNPEKRAGYDATYKRVRAKRWKIFNQPKAAQSVEGEQALRQGILGLLYTKRRVTPSAPGMTAVELEDLLGVPREHLEFPLWYLKENTFISRTDNGRYAITVQGVNQAEQQRASWLNPPAPERMRIEAAR